MVTVYRGTSNFFSEIGVLVHDVDFVRVPRSAVEELECDSGD